MLLYADNRYQYYTVWEAPVVEVYDRTYVYTGGTNATDAKLFGSYYASVPKKQFDFDNAIPLRSGVLVRSSSNSSARVLFEKSH